MSNSRLSEDNPWTVIFQSHRQAFIATAERITGSRSHAEDIVQEAFLKLLSGPLPGSISSKAGYLMRMVRNLAIDQYRRSRMEQRYFAMENGQIESCSKPLSPESISQDREAIRALSDALSKLPDRSRYAFEMHRIHGVSQKDIADQLGVSPTLVHFMIRDALIHCRNSLNDDVEAG
ncbi:MAG: RNA polymerase factor sigma-70 [Rhodospirillum sp.]|nr:RNA polymerase factor sigma-70 [Rhodospirillum sp.]MCF8490227.1 RNA polymerase factor sigma-70 [Rhodospirillum sp.]MCF8500996.1 RNA polymerase factor sigma-70 [Rhodospirillum sp.]